MPRIQTSVELIKLFNKSLNDVVDKMLERNEYLNSINEDEVKKLHDLHRILKRWFNNNGFMPI